MNFEALDTITKKIIEWLKKIPVQKCLGMKTKATREQKEQEFFDEANYDEDMPLAE